MSILVALGLVLVLGLSGGVISVIRGFLGGGWASGVSRGVEVVSRPLITSQAAARCTCCRSDSRGEDNEERRWAISGTATASQPSCCLRCNPRHDLPWA